MLFYSKQDKAVLLFHRILPERDPLWDPIDPSLFKTTLDFIRKKFHIVSLNEILFEKNDYSSKPFAALTFDDGYRDFIDYAIPMLDKVKMKASMFVVTDCIDNNMPTWTYIIDYIFTNSVKMEWTNFNTTELPEEYRKTKWDSKEEKMGYCKKFKQHLKWIAASERDNIIKSLVENFSDTTYPHNMMMSWNDLRQIYSGGFGIGSHSVTHPTLATIKDDDIIKNELKQSAKRTSKTRCASSGAPWSTPPIWPARRSPRGPSTARSTCSRPPPTTTRASSSTSDDRPEWPSSRSARRWAPTPTGRRGPP